MKTSHPESPEEAGNLIKITVLRKVFSKQLYFIRSRREHLRTIEYRRYSRITFVENTISNSPKVLRTKFLESDGFFCFNRMCKFGSLKNTLTAITILSELYFRLRRFILLVQTKEMIYKKLWQQHKPLTTMQMSET